jgi:hypothetical protein
MRCARIGVVACFLYLAVSLEAQQTQPIQTQTSTTQSPAPQDAQAVSVLTQALATAGGTPAIQAIGDFTATGNVTYHWNPEEQGSVTIQGLGVSEIRIDSSLPSGQHSESIHDGQTARKKPNGTLWQYPPPYPVPSSDAFPYQPPMFPGSFVIPVSQVAAILNNSRCSISYKGIVQVDGGSVHDIQVQRILPGQTIPDGMAEYHTIEIFIDTTTLQIAMTQDNVPNHIVHRIRYSDYRPVSGILVPFSIGEETGGQKTRDIQLSQVSFNGGLQDSAFEIIQ